MANLAGNRICSRAGGRRPRPARQRGARSDGTRKSRISGRKPCFHSSIIAASRQNFVAQRCLNNTPDRKPTMPKIDRPDAEWRHLVTPEEYRVTRERHRTRLTGRYWIATKTAPTAAGSAAAPPFAPKAKFDSGCGWPSFTAPTDETPHRRTYRPQLRHGPHRSHLFPMAPISATSSRRPAPQRAALLHQFGVARWRNRLTAFGSRGETRGRVQAAAAWKAGKSGGHHWPPLSIPDAPACLQWGGTLTALTIRDRWEPYRRAEYHGSGKARCRWTGERYRPRLGTTGTGWVRCRRKTCCLPEQVSLKGCIVQWHLHSTSRAIQTNRLFYLNNNQNTFSQICGQWQNRRQASGNISPSPPCYDRPADPPLELPPCCRRPPVRVTTPL